eukprot:449547-Rhodomonas_salina.3
MERGEAHWLSRCLFVVDDAWDLGSLSTPGKTLFSTTAGTVRAHKEREAGAPNAPQTALSLIRRNYQDRQRKGNNIKLRDAKRGSGKATTTSRYFAPSVQDLQLSVEVRSGHEHEDGRGVNTREKDEEDQHGEVSRMCGENCRRQRARGFARRIGGERRMKGMLACLKIGSFSVRSNPGASAENPPDPGAKESLPGEMTKKGEGGGNNSKTGEGPLCLADSQE